jgi:hypothetical protein
MQHRAMGDRAIGANLQRGVIADVKHRVVLNIGIIANLDGPHLRTRDRVGADRDAPPSPDLAIEKGAGMHKGCC